MSRRAKRVGKAIAIEVVALGVALIIAWASGLTPLLTAYLCIPFGLVGGVFALSWARVI